MMYLHKVLMVSYLKKCLVRGFVIPNLLRDLLERQLLDASAGQASTSSLLMCFGTKNYFYRWRVYYQ